MAIMLVHRGKNALEHLRERLIETVGGKARFHVIAVLASILALDSADTGAVGAISTELRSYFRVSLVAIGLLVTAKALVGAVTTLPFGVLVDRFNRVRLLSISVVAWSATMIFSAISQTYLMLLVSRIGLGAVTAAVGPAVASLTGDFFPESERGKVYGYILTGQLLGTGFGFLVAGDFSSLFGWRAAFVVLGLPGFVLAWVITWLLVEPARRGRSQLQLGATELIPAEEAENRPEPEETNEPKRGDTVVIEAIQKDDVKPDPANILHSDPTTMPLARAVRFVFQVRTNVYLIIASSLGYFFLTGVETFAFMFVAGFYGISQSVASSMVPILGVGAVTGTILGGRISDHLLRRGRSDARILVSAICFLVAPIVGLPALLSHSLYVAIPSLILTAAGLSAANPPLDAARLDIMPAQMWGRAEAVRTVLLTLATAFAPLLFGFVADEFGARRLSGFSAGHTKVTATGAHGLDMAFLVMLIPLFVSGITVFLAKRTYRVDVATAAASEGWNLGENA